ncbi:MAG: hypothetical protein CM1200mP36_11110 [Gammaproteobacteria bacterium]|nr:MAG: hypothetical protein CM1200mP36_11110 [Gammaproteobacteria bacterium]
MRFDNIYARLMPQPRFSFQRQLLHRPSGHRGVIDRFFQPLTTAVSNIVFFTVPLFGADLPLVVLWLIAGGVFFTGYFGLSIFEGSNIH